MSNDWLLLAHCWISNPPSVRTCCNLSTRTFANSAVERLWRQLTKKGWIGDNQMSTFPSDEFLTHVCNMYDAQKGLLAVPNGRSCRWHTSGSPLLYASFTIEILATSGQLGRDGPSETLYRCHCWLLLNTAWTEEGPHAVFGQVYGLAVAGNSGRVHGS